MKKYMENMNKYKENIKEYDGMSEKYEEIPLQCTDSGTFLSSRPSYGLWNFKKS